MRAEAQGLRVGGQGINKYNSLFQVREIHVYSSYQKELFYFIILFTSYRETGSAKEIVSVM